MARYIDGEKLLEYYEERYKNLCKKNGETDAYCQGYEDAMYVAEHIDFTADVVPRSEVERLKKERDEYKKHVDSDIIYVHRIKADVAREIFEEIENALFDNHCVDDGTDFHTPHYIEELKDDIAELKKKYTEVKDGTQTIS